MTVRVAWNFLITACMSIRLLYDLRSDYHGVRSPHESPKLSCSVPEWHAAPGCAHPGEDGRPHLRRRREIAPRLRRSPVERTRISGHLLCDASLDGRPRAFHDLAGDRRDPQH